MRIVMCVEGHDGAGKTTFVDAMTYVLELTDIEHCTIKFPSCVPPEDADASWFIEDFERTFEEDHGLRQCMRAEHSVIILDRSFVSTMVYQAILPRMCENAASNERRISDLRHHESLQIAGEGLMQICRNIYPDMLQFFHAECPVKVAVERIEERMAANGGEALDDTERVQEESGNDALCIHIELLRRAYREANGYVTGLFKAFDESPLHHYMPRKGMTWAHMPWEQHPLWNARLNLSCLAIHADASFLSMDEYEKVMAATDEFSPY